MEVTPVRENFDCGRKTRKRAENPIKRIEEDDEKWVSASVFLNAVQSEIQVSEQGMDFPE